MIVIGLGTGRTGTASLASLFDNQLDAMCFHELNPACATFDGNPQSVLNTIMEFNRIIAGGDRSWLTVDYGREMSVRKYEQLIRLKKNPRIMGDIAYYYLMYVPEILKIDSTVKFVCIKRDKQETVESWMRKSRIGRWRSLRLADWLRSCITRQPYHTEYNFWQKHDGTRYALNPIWDSTFPKFEANSKREAIEKYWDFYYEHASKLEMDYPLNFRIFDIAQMSNTEGQKQILSFSGIEEQDMVLKEKYHLHQSRK